MKLSKKQRAILSSGTYAQKQIFAKHSFWLRLSHTARFTQALKYIKRIAPKKILDYGCGDGTLLILLEEIVPEKIGVDIDPKQVLACQTRLKDNPAFTFNHISTLSDFKDKSIPFIICTEVLEHVPERNIDAILNVFDRLLTDDGHLLISVPIETGISLVFKQLIRTLAGLRKIGTYQYTKHYSWRELCAAIFATSKSRLGRVETVIEFSGFRYESTEHKGFNWKQLYVQLATRYLVEEKSFSPFNFFKSCLNSQVWFLCEKR